MIDDDVDGLAEGAVGGGALEEVTCEIALLSVLSAEMSTTTDCPSLDRGMLGAVAGGLLALEAALGRGRDSPSAGALLVC